MGQQRAPIPALGGLALAVLAMTAGLPGRAQAAEVTADPDAPLALEVHGFASQGYLRTTSNNYLADSVHGSFDFTEVGVNFTKPLTDNLRVGLQLFSRKLGPIGNYEVKADWFYLDYRWRDWLGLRAGRVKLPLGLYNDTSDIDSARVPILLPQSIYPATSRDYLLAQTGGELYGHFNLRAAGALDYRLYGGTIFIDDTQPPGSPITILELRTPYVFGGRLLWEPIEGLRAGWSMQSLRLDTTLLYPGGLGEVVARIPVVISVGSLEYAGHDLLLSAEYSRWSLSVQSSNPALFPDVGNETSERAFVMAAYRVRRWFEPGVYYSLLVPDVDHQLGRAGEQNDFAATLRFDVNAYWIIKLEAHYMAGTAGLDPTLNDNTPLAALAPSWAVFLAKTTVSF